MMLVMWNWQTSLYAVFTVDLSPPLSCADLDIICDSPIRYTIVPNNVLIFIWSLALPRHELNFGELACFESKQLKIAKVPSRNN